MATKKTDVPFARIEVGEIPNSRTAFEGIDELADSIRENGLLQPLLVWHKRCATKEIEVDGKVCKVSDRYILVAGERRYRAIKRIRRSHPDAFDSVACSLVEGNEADALAAQLVENLQRQDMKPGEVADGIDRMTKLGLSQAKIAKKLGKSQAWVSRIAAFHAQASEPLREATATGAIPFTVAAELAALPEAAQRVEVERVLAASVPPTFKCATCGMKFDDVPTLTAHQAVAGHEAAPVGHITAGALQQPVTASDVRWTSRAVGGEAAPAPSNGAEKRQALREARDRAREATGKAVRPAAKIVRAHIDTLRGGEAEGEPEQGTAAWGAWKALLWREGHGAWPKGLPRPKEA